MASSLAVDESSDIRGDSSLNVTEEFLALRPVHGTTTGQDLYEEVSRCGNEMELPREKLVGWTTDGAAAMCGHRSGLVAKIREKMQEENVTAELTAHHCIILLESLCAEALNMEHGMFTITHAGNFIRAKGLIQRQFKAFLSQWQTQRGDLPHHTEGPHKVYGCRLGEWVEQSRNAEPRGKDVNPRNRAVPLTAGRSDRKGLTGEEADDVAEQTGDEQQQSRGQAEKSKPGEQQTGTRNAEAEVVVRGRKQVSGAEAGGQEGTGEMEL
ncbi:hypothetical protein D4764_0096710 [Takifugu flavidus]|uniref:DUF4371 domain-containing protein n=1 Tax=Takifugu flavidus TaxID=433684 RepID=A0A5C6MI60_9TELE|nr:hypothetical protein D4764_0096710 [Takifugu flavidus]